MSKQAITVNTEIRAVVVSQLKKLKSKPKSYQRKQVILKLNEAILWLGEDSRQLRIKDV